MEIFFYYIIIKRSTGEHTDLAKLKSLARTTLSKADCIIAFIGKRVITKIANSNQREDFNLAHYSSRY